LGQHPHRQGHASPVRRVSSPTPGTTEQRPWGLPPRADRATQALVKHVLEPAWEAAFNPHSDGFRLGRSTWEAIGALSVQSNQKPTGVVDADLAQGVDRASVSRPRHTGRDSLGG
jgi:RNA-directed DNA polymerase